MVKFKVYVSFWGDAMFKQPIPAIGRRSYGNNLWDGYSTKLKRNVNLNSDLEHDHWILVETDPEIVDFCEQPLKIVHSIDGKRRESIFDMWILKKDGSSYLIEVKYSDDLNPKNPKSARALEQTRYQQSWCELHGHNYLIRTEEHIRENLLYLANMKKVLRYTRNRASSIDTNRYKIIEHLNQNPISLKNLAGLLTEIPRSRMYEAISWLVYEGEIATNLDTKRFGPETEVWLVGK